MKVRGENVVLFIYDGGVWLGYACATSMSLNLTTDFIETSVSGTGTFATFLPTKDSWGLSIEGIVALQESGMLSLADLRQRQLSHSILLMRFQRTADGGEVYTDEGSFYISNSSDSGSFDGMQTFTIEGKGSGVITQIFTPQPLTPPDAIQVERYEYTGVGSEYSFVPLSGLGVPLLIGKRLLEANKDGIAYSPVITSGTPVSKEVKFSSVTGTVQFPTPFEPGEQAYVLYQD